MRTILFSLPLFFLCNNLLAQSSTKERLDNFQQWKMKSSPFHDLEFRNIGPTIMSGRVTDIDVNPNKTTEFYVAYASGGVWYSNNNGQSFTPVFDHEASITIGDIAVNWNKNIIWVGTGEVNSSRSSYAGTGVYQSTDSGKTWQHLGLEESHHIGKVILHPTNEKIAWVAVLGHLYTSNPERGIYKTTDGGKTWQQTLFVNDSTGCPDLLINPSNPDVLYASTWTRTRKAWQFNGSGDGSGIYKSIDGGEHWQCISNAESGFPTGKGVGRIGLAISYQQSNTLYAVLDNNNNQEQNEEDKNKLKARDIETMSTEAFLSLENKKLETYLRTNEYSDQYTAESVKKDIRDKKYSVKAVADWRLADADASLFDTPVYGAELYKSTDGGKTWTKTHSELLGGVFFTYGYYFATISVSPQNDQHVFIGGYPIIHSEDGGKTFGQLDGDNCHPDYHRIWINPLDDKHIIACNDGGVNISYDGGQVWFKANNPAVGQFYSIQLDNEKPYNVYGGLQDNGTWYGPSTHIESNGWMQEGAYAYKNVGGGDGMQVQVDSRTNDIYFGYQFGNYMRMSKQDGNVSGVKPEYLIGEKPLRFNWQTPILLSKHNEDFFYIGSNYVHRSLQKGNNLEKLSPELTNTKQHGNVPFGTVTTLSESPLRFGLLYAGTDDGNVHVSKDVAYTWTKISNPLPQQKWITRVVASKHKLERVYVSLNGYRNDDFKAYVFVSNDYGKTWTDISSNLPSEPVNVIREDPVNEKIIYVGTDNGLYVSVDGGKNYMAWQSNLPRVAIHDMLIHERENELVLGTHGRSIYIAPLASLQEYPKLRDKDLFLFPLDTIRYQAQKGNKGAVYAKPVEQRIRVNFYTAHDGSAELSVYQGKTKILHQENVQVKAGFNHIDYDGSVKETASKQFNPVIKIAEDGKYYLPQGNYRIVLKIGTFSETTWLYIK